MLDATDDYQRIVAWRNTPHVWEWWDPDDPPFTLDTAIMEYSAYTRESSATTACIIEVNGVETGYVQFFPWAAYRAEQEAAGIQVPVGAWSLDIFIGEEDALDRGIGSRVVALVCRYLFEVKQASAVAFGVAVENLRARRAYEKAGLQPTVEFLDTDIKHGQRIPSILMIRYSPRPV
jgi:RimJ/RimL family protein N-acetyltransferase